MVQINKLEALALKLGLLFSKIQGEHSLVALSYFMKMNEKKLKNDSFFIRKHGILL